MSHELTVLTERLIAGLSAASVRVLHQMWDDQAFGSGLVEIGRVSSELRLIWDGKDGWAYLQKARPDGTWTDIAGPISESDFRSGTPDDQKVEEMVKAAQVAIGG